MQDKILLVDKPAGWTSFDVVAKIRGKIRADYRARGEKPTKRQQKVGHAGTLDPFATGLLIILLGDATKRANEFLKLDKVYEATLQLGEVSTTGDPEGEITAYESGARSQEIGNSQTSQDDGVDDKEIIFKSYLNHISQSDIEAVLQDFVGKIEQTPPQFSAIKVNGQRAYKLARKGEKVDIPKRSVTIYKLELVDYNYPELKIRTHVSSGTYIRTLAEDIGLELGVGAYCKSLRRLQIADYKVGDATDVQTLTK